MLAETQHPYDLYTQQQLLERPLEPCRAIAIDPPKTKEVDDAIYVNTAEDDDGHFANITVYVADAAPIIEHKDLCSRAFDLGFSRYDENPRRLMLPRFALQQLSLGNKSELGAPAVAIRIRADEAKTALLGIDRVRVRVRPTTYDGYARMINRGNPTAIAIAKNTAMFRDRTRLGKPYRYTNDSHKIVADYMLLANMMVAENAQKQGTPWIYRNFTNSKQARSDRHYQYAEYATAPLPHDCVGGKPYCHFTSPLRRVVDSVNHAIHLASTEGTPLPYSSNQLHEMSDQVNIQMHYPRSATPSVA